MSTTSTPTSLPASRRPAHGLVSLAAWPLRRLLARLLRGVARGALAITLPDGQRLEGRGAAPGPHAAIQLLRWRAIARLALRGDIGLAESYRDGDWSTPDLAALLEFGIRNQSGWDCALDAAWPARALDRLRHLMRANTRRGSRHNIAFHYDMGNAFYGQWLDRGMQYSGALYRDAAESLEDAQAAKLRRVLSLLELERLPAEASILEIGCGWGALALELAQLPSAGVVGLTLSKEQLAYARARISAAGAQERVDLRLQDYRDVDGRYDRIASIEMLEAVGERYWPAYFETLRARLKPDGVAVLQVITIADEHFDHYRRGADFIQRFIFPGGMLPSVGAMREQAARAGLSFTVAESFGLGYARTLVEWRERFVAAWPAIEALGFDASFKRMWEYYLCYCEAGFRSGRVDVGLYTLRHAGPPSRQCPPPPPR
ncbi:MAG TPA: cyclopropane-fatty-acyl-phospholipid synthase family protein [Burkholderiaceae bacterium]|jgi:cyclopropane-fatty-acyl-phospholipid synthase